MLSLLRREREHCLWTLLSCLDCHAAESYRAAVGTSGAGVEICKVAATAKRG